MKIVKNRLDMRTQLLKRLLKIGVQSQTTASTPSIHSSHMLDKITYDLLFLAVRH